MFSIGGRLGFNIVTMDDRAGAALLREAHNERGSGETRAIEATLDLAPDHPALQNCEKS